MRRARAALGPPLSVVLDADVPTVLASGDPRHPKPQALIRGWLEAGEELHAPALHPYEVANGPTRLVVAGAFPPERLAEAWRAVRLVPITRHSRTEGWVSPVGRAGRSG